MALVNLCFISFVVIVTCNLFMLLGKGVTASSVGVVLKMLNIPITAIKIDPYLNVDAGTMSPFEHGECFVLGMFRHM